MNNKEFSSIKFLSLKREGVPNNLVVHQNQFPQEIKSTIFNLRKFEKPEKIPTESCRHVECMNDKEL